MIVLKRKEKIQELAAYRRQTYQALYSEEVCSCKSHSKGMCKVTVSALLRIASEGHLNVEGDNKKKEEPKRTETQT